MQAAPRGVPGSPQCDLLRPWRRDRVALAIDGGDE